jgi:hypothetical protein
MTTADANKALALAGRYARLQIRSGQCRTLCARLLDQCENLRHVGDGEALGFSGCMESYRDWKSEAAKGEAKRPNSPQGWAALLEQDLEFCRPCLLAMKVWGHRKTMHRRRASVLGAIKRVGVRHQAMKGETP